MITIGCRNRWFFDSGVGRGKIVLSVGLNNKAGPKGQRGDNPVLPMMAGGEP